MFTTTPDTVCTGTKTIPDRALGKQSCPIRTRFENMQETLKFEVNGQIAFKLFKDWSDYRSKISDYLMPDHDLRSVESVSPSLALVYQLSVCLRES